jgi:hypothetical protein
MGTGYLEVIKVSKLEEFAIAGQIQEKLGKKKKMGSANCIVSPDCNTYCLTFFRVWIPLGLFNNDVVNVQDATPGLWLMELGYISSHTWSSRNGHDMPLKTPQER